MENPMKMSGHQHRYSTFKDRYVSLIFRNSMLLQQNVDYLNYIN